MCNMQKSMRDINVTVSEHSDTNKLTDTSLSAMNGQNDAIKNNTVAAVDENMEIYLLKSV